MSFSNQCESFCFLAEGIRDQAEVYVCRKKRNVSLDIKCDCALTVGGTTEPHWANYRLRCAAKLLW